MQKCLVFFFAKVAYTQKIKYYEKIRLLYIEKIAQLFQQRAILKLNEKNKNLKTIK